MGSRIKAVLSASVLAVLLNVGAASAAPPSVTIDQPSDVSFTSVDVTGTVNPMGTETFWRAEYSTDETNWNQFGGGVAGAGSEPVAVETEIFGLEPGTQYYLRIGASNADGESYSAPPNPTFTTPTYPAPEASLDPVELNGLDAHLTGSVDPNGIAAKWRLELAVDDGKPDWYAVAKGVSSSSDPIAVEADVELSAQTKYLARLTASSNGGTVVSTELAFATGVAAPRVRVLPGSGRTTTGVRLNATISPNGLPTEYRFEWGTSTSYGNVIPSSGGDAYAGQGSETARYSKPIEGLAPNTTIHYRVIAHNAEGTTVSPDQTVVTLAQPIVYEMVSPPNKEGSNLFFCCTSRSSVDGERAQFMSAGVFSGGGSNLQLNTYLSSRGSDNWSTKFLPLPQTTKNGGFTNGGTQGFSPELTKAFLFSREALLPGAVVDNSNMYQRDLVTGELKFVATFEDNSYGMVISDANIFQGTTPDGDHMAFRSIEPLTSDAVVGDAYGANFYDYANGELRLLSILPNDEAVKAEDIGRRKDRLKFNPLSDDGSRFFFMYQQQLYLREGGETVRVSASQRTGGPEGPPPPVDVGAWASKDGSAIYFSIFGGGGDKGLTDDAPDFFGNGQHQLYRYDSTSGGLTYIGYGSEGPADTNSVGKILSVSDDGETVWFSAGHFSGASAFEPFNRIYVVRDGVTRFVGETDLAEQEYVHEGAASPSGRYFAMQSVDPGLSSPPARTCEGEGCTQLFVADADAPETGFSCASCNPTGAFTSPTELRFEAEENTGGNLNRVVLDNGDVFFQSEDRLVPEDTNDKIDVYRWNGGQLDLISRGWGKEHSFYGDATPDGRSIFFYTGEHLVTQDVDSSQDLYVARVNGGLSGQNPPPPEQPCFGEGCLDRSPNPPADVTPGSNGFHGPANPSPAFKQKKRCGKGKVRKRVKGKSRCVKRKAKRTKGGNK